MRVTSEDIVSAYQRTGSVWKAGRELGTTGQVVHQRLRALGYKLAGSKWSQDEVAELRSLAGHMTIGEIARRLGRPYAGVACKISELGIGSRYGNQVKVKVPRGEGYDKASLTKYVREIDRTDDLVTRFARRNGLGIEPLVQALERHLPDWWDGYRRTHSDLPERTCEGCERVFIPGNTKQRYCTRQCASRTRTDRAYFGGNRVATIGLAEGVCQLCRRSVSKGLSSHHVLGKENDPDNLNLVALCPGCHKLVTLAATRSFVNDNEAWEDFITLVWLRKNGANVGYGIYVTVEVESLSEEDVEDELEDAVSLGGPSSMP